MPSEGWHKKPRAKMQHFYKGGRAMCNHRDTFLDTSRLREQPIADIVLCSTCGEVFHGKKVMCGNFGHCILTGKKELQV